MSKKDKFQFHCGAIKREQFIWKAIYFLNFNSIVVRLKALSLSFFSCVLRLFQFHCGAIKSSFLHEDLLLNANFNSIVVRLKASTMLDWSIAFLISIPLWCD